MGKVCGVDGWSLIFCSTPKLEKALWFVIQRGFLNYQVGNWRASSCPFTMYWKYTTLTSNDKQMYFTDHQKVGCLCYFGPANQLVSASETISEGSCGLPPCLFS